MYHVSNAYPTFRKLNDHRPLEILICSSPAARMGPSLFSQFGARVKIDGRRALSGPGWRADPDGVSIVDPAAPLGLGDAGGWGFFFTRRHFQHPLCIFFQTFRSTASLSLSGVDDFIRVPALDLGSVEGRDCDVIDLSDY